jgi:formylglycine-generating enzyme required for sulfatase activity
LVEQIESAITALKKWQDQFKDHEQLLQKLASDLEAGHLSAAAVSSEKLGERKFAGLNYQPTTDLQALESALKELRWAERGTASRLVKELRAKHPKAGAQTELIQELNKHQARSTSETRKALFVALLVLGLGSAAGKVALDTRREQQRWVARLSTEVQSRVVGGKLEIPLSSTLFAQFCFIPSGSFTMGSSSSEERRSSDEGQVEVTLSQPFWLAKTEVTQAQWEAVMGSNPSQFKGSNLPVESVSWEDAKTFTAKLNDESILPEGWKFALPTEAQWEFACRAGEKGPYSGGSLGDVGWYDDNSEEKTHEVGQKKTNAWGLQDMHGNVWEWCADWYAETLQGGVDPKGHESRFSRVNRGGSWDVINSSCRAAYRGRSTPDSLDYRLGFRPAIVKAQ